MSKYTAPGTCAVTYSARASRLSVGRYQAASRRDCHPSVHVVTIDAAREGTISAMRHSRRLRHTHTAPGTWPRAYTSLVSTLRVVAPSKRPGPTLGTELSAR